MNIKIYPNFPRPKTSFDFPFLAKNHKDIVRVIRYITGGKKAPNGIPYYQDVQGWAERATIGETYETDDFKAICVEE